MNKCPICARGLSRISYLNYKDFKYICTKKCYTLFFNDVNELASENIRYKSGNASYIFDNYFENISLTNVAIQKANEDVYSTTFLKIPQISFFYDKTLDIKKIINKVDKLILIS